MIIVSHRLFLSVGDGEVEIDIHIHQPVIGHRCWTCRYETHWPEGRQTRDAVGHDALQALTLALEMIGADIYSSTYHREGRLRAYEKELGYGFPVASSLRHLLVGVDAI